MKTLGEKLKAIRKERNLTQEDIAFQLGIATNNFAKIERDEVDISLSRIQQIAKILDMNIAELFNYGEPKNNNQIELDNYKKMIYEKDMLIHHLQKDLMKALKKG